MKVLHEPIQVRQQRFVTDDGWSYRRAHGQSLGGQLYPTANRQAKCARTTLPPMAIGKRRRHVKWAADVGGNQRSAEDQRASVLYASMGIGDVARRRCAHVT